MKRFVSTTENLEIINAIAERLRSAKVGEIIRKKDLDNLVKGKPHLLNRARRMVEKQHGCIFATIIREGIKKLPTSDTHLVGEKARIKAVRGLKNSQGRIIAVIRSNAGDMTTSERLQTTNEINKLGLAIEFCK